MAWFFKNKHTGLYGLAADGGGAFGRGTGR